jgi:hypothetical protein
MKKEYSEKRRGLTECERRIELLRIVRNLHLSKIRRRLCFLLMPRDFSRRRMDISASIMRRKSREFFTAAITHRKLIAAFKKAV